MNYAFQPLRRKGRSKLGGPDKYRRRWALMWAQAGQCAACDKLMDPDGDPLGPDYPTLDHVYSFSRGGAHAVANLLLKHRRCNEARGDAWPTRKDIDWLAKVQERLPNRPPTTEGCRVAAMEILRARRAS